MDIIGKLDIRYVAGLIDADGSFALYLDTRNATDRCPFTPRWVVNFRQIHKDIVQKVYEKFGVGKVYYSRRITEDRPGIWSWQTTRLVDTLKVCRILRPHLWVKSSVCDRFIDSLTLWMSYPKKGRPISLYKSLFEIWTTANNCTQTITQRSNKSDKIIDIGNVIKSMVG